MTNPFHQKNFQYLKNAYLADNLHHSYVFYGESGGGKFEFTTHFARFLQCENNKNGEPCEKCKSCKVSHDGFITNTYILNKEGGESITINDIREIQRSEELSVAGGGRKVFIINNAQNLTREASEALLKTLEEPSKKALIILITEEKKLLPKTVLSRCPAVFFGKKNSDDLNLFGDSEYIDELFEQLEILFADMVFEKMILAQQLANDKDVQKRIRGWLTILYMLFSKKNGNLAETASSTKKLESLEKKFSYDKIIEVLEKANNLLNLLDTNVSKRVLFEDFVLDI